MTAAARRGPGAGPGPGTGPWTGPGTVPGPGTGPGQRDPLLRLLVLARPLRGQLVLAVAAGAAATGCGVALLAVSGFLLARASQHPNIIAISAAVVAVRALSAGRGAFRYLERLASHDAAFRILADVRVSIFRRLERLAPAGLTALRSGDLLAGLIAAGVGIPVLAARIARDAARRVAPARGQLSATVTDLLAGAADLHAFGAEETALAAVTAADEDLARQARRNAAVNSLSTGLSSAIAGVTLWGVLLLGVAATGDGVLTRVPLAVLTLTALASFEAVTVLPAAAVQLGQARVSAHRIAAVLDAPDPVREPASPRRLPDGPVRVELHGARVRYQPGGPFALDGIDLDLPP